MTPEERARLEAEGFRFGTVAEFLELTPEDEEIVEIRVAVARLVRERRKQTRTTQSELAGKIGSDQARISRLERNDSSVSLDQMIEAAVTLGAHRKDIAEALVR